MIYFAVPMVAAYLLPKEVDIAFPDLEQLNAQFEAARRDREERVRRLLDKVDTVDDAMSRFVNHDFVRAEELEIASGWLMTVESGELFHRSTLQRQAQIFDSLGKSAVPDLLKWLGHDQIEIRYIASYALERISGLNPQFPHFATLEELVINGWLAETRAEYENWMSTTHEAESPDHCSTDRHR